MRGPGFNQELCQEWAGSGKLETSGGVVSRSLILVAIVVILQLGAAVYGEAAEEDRAGTGQAYSRGIVVVKLAPSSSSDPGTRDDPAGILSELVAQYASEIRSFSVHQGLDYWIGRTAQDADIEELCQRLRGHPSVSDASPDYLASFAETIPTDPHFQWQYSLRNTGQIYHPASGRSGTPGSDIKASHGWDVERGAVDVVIAVIDSGVAGNHEDLLGKIVAGYNFVADTPDAYDDHGHGTFVASIAAAMSDNGLGMTGVSWGSPIMPVKVMDASGYGSYLAIAVGIRFAADRGARVINLSIAGSNPSFILEDACEYAYSLGAVIVAAVGNNGGYVMYPAGYDDYCLAVAATDAHDEWPQWSNSGPQVDIGAPGDLVFGARIDPNDPTDLSSYGWDSGTSYATPHVAGAAALLISRNPALSHDQVIDILKSTADDVNQATHPGVDDLIGHGRLDIRNLLSAGAQPAVDSLGPIGRTAIVALIAALGVTLLMRRSL
jgi:subtilisin family serine protease